MINSNESDIWRYSQQAVGQEKSRINQWNLSGEAANRQSAGRWRQNLSTGLRIIVGIGTHLLSEFAFVFLARNRAEFKSPVKAGRT